MFSVRASRLTFISTPPFSVNLRALPPRFIKYLVQPVRITYQHIVQLIVNSGHQLQAFIFCPVRQGIFHLLHHVRHREVYFLQLQLTGFNLRQVQNVINNVQQYVRRFGDRFKVISCSGRGSLCSSRLVIPLMAFIGVRISWLILAMKSCLNFSERSARNFCCIAFFLSLTMKNIHTRQHQQTTQGQVNVSTLQSQPSFFHIQLVLQQLLSVLLQLQLALLQFQLAFCQLNIGSLQALLLFCQCQQLLLFLRIHLLERKICL
jgi:hypothetical protein